MPRPPPRHQCRSTSWSVGERVLVDGAFTPPRSAFGDGLIARVAPLGSGSRATRIVRLADDEVLMPGLVDTHVHVNEPGRTEWEGFATATRAAAAGGVTTIVDMPLEQHPADDRVAALEVKRERPRGGCRRRGILGRRRARQPRPTCGRCTTRACSGSSASSCTRASRSSRALGVGGDGGGDARARRVRLAAHRARRGRRRDRRAAHRRHALRGLPGVPAARAPRPPRSPRSSSVPRRTGAAAHILHSQRGDALGAIAQAKRDGVRLSVETCPHYLDADRGGGARRRHRVQVLPAHPRGRRTVTRCGQGLRDGTIDFVVSDHSPAPAELKLAGDGTSPRRGAASRRSSSGCRSSGPRRAAAAFALAGSWSGCPRRRRAGSASPQGRDRRGTRRGPRGVRADARFTVDAEALRAPASDHALRRPRTRRGRARHLPRRRAGRSCGAARPAAAAGRIGAWGER